MWDYLIFLKFPLVESADILGNSEHVLFQLYVYQPNISSEITPTNSVFFKKNAFIIHIFSFTEFCMTFVILLRIMSNYYVYRYTN